MFLSKSLLMKFGPKISTCIRQTHTEHENIEISRCVRMVTGVGCVSAWEASSLFYQQFGKTASHQDNFEEISDRIRGMLHLSVAQA